MRAFVLGCGPSVDQLDLGHLRGETVCILNTVILRYRELPFSPSFYLLNDSTLSRDPQILRAVEQAERDGSFTVVKSKNAGGSIYPRSGNRWTMCKDATAVAIDLLIDHGYTEIILLGLDFNYQGYGTGEMIRDETQHFQINGKDIYHGIAWKFPDMPGKRLALLEVSRYAEEQGVKVWNATKGSKCEIFEKTSRFEHWQKHGRRIVALHTARAGSKSVPNKNLLECHGKPLFLHNLLFAKQSKYIECVYASSDIPKVLSMANDWGYEPIQRPPELAIDTVGHYEVIRHALDHIERGKSNVDLMVVLLANNAGAYPEDLDRGIEALLNDPSLDGVMSVSEFNMFNPFRAHRVNGDGLIETILSQAYIRSHPTNTYSGDRKLLGSVYFYNGSFWICRRDNILENDGNLPWPWLGKKIKPIIQKDVMEVDESWQVDVVRQVLAANA